MVSLAKHCTTGTAVLLFPHRTPTADATGGIGRPQWGLAGQQQRRAKAGRHNWRMSDNPTTPPDQEQPKKKRFILAIAPAKARVETTAGPLFVRHAYLSDHEHFGCDDDAERGRVAVQRLVSRVEQKGDDTPLDVDVAVLTDVDVEALLPVIAKQSGWEAPEPGTGFKGLGLRIKEAELRAREDEKEALEKMHESLKANYAFLMPSTLSKLQDQITGLATLRDGMHSGLLKDVMSPHLTASATVAAALKEIGAFDALSGTQSAAAALAANPMLGAAQREMEEAFRRFSPESAALTEAMREADRLKKLTQLPTTAQMAMDLAHATGAPKLSAEIQEVTRAIEIPAIKFEKPLKPPRLEDTKVGRATLESAKHIEVVANEIGTVAKNIGNLNQVMVSEVFPQWFKQVKEGQESAKEEARKTSSSLRWTKWAVFASVVVTIVATWWQDRVARELDAGNTEHQKAVVELLNNQLAAQQRLIEQQDRDAAQLRDALSALQKSQAGGSAAAALPTAARHQR